MLDNRERQRRYREKAVRYGEIVKALHPSILAQIGRLSENEEEKSRRISNAVEYELLFPSRPYTGV